MLVFDAQLSSCLNMLSDDRNKVFLELLSVHFFTVFYLMYNFAFVCVLYNKNQPTTAIYMISSSQEDRGNYFFLPQGGGLYCREPWLGEKVMQGNILFYPQNGGLMVCSHLKKNLLSGSNIYSCYIMSSHNTCQNFDYFLVPFLSRMQQMSL